MPFLAKFLVFIVVFGLIAAIFYLCLRKYFKKFLRSDRTRASGLAMTGGKVDLKNVQLLGQAYKEKVSYFIFLDFKYQSLKFEALSLKTQSANNNKKFLEM